MESPAAPLTLCSELPAMLATLGTYEERFGPYSEITLRLMVLVAGELARIGRPVQSRMLLEKVARDVGRVFGAEHRLRIDALTRLRDRFLAEGDFVRATAVQRELTVCQPGKPEERERFAAMVL